MQDASHPAPPIFKASDLCYEYDGRIAALHHIDLHVQAGERLAVLGSNGSGKSTLLKILDGLYFPSSGTLQFCGEPLSEQSLRSDAFNFKFRSQVGFVFQDSDVQLFMPSVWDEVAFAPLQLGISTEEVNERVSAALHALNIEKISSRAPHQLSGGEKKRVALASVLSLAPQVWLLDEPSAGLDPRSTTWLVDFIRSQEDSGRTIVFTTHDLNFVEAAADRVYVLDEQHRLAAEGSPHQILADRALLTAANLI